MHRPSPAYRFLLAGFLWSFGGNLVYFFLNFHLEALGFSRQAIGLAQAVLLLSGVAFALYALGIALWPWAFAKASPRGRPPGGRGGGPLRAGCSSRKPRPPPGPGAGGGSGPQRDL